MDYTVILVSIFSAVTVAVTWLGKEIVKPWSDAALQRSKAFADYVEQQGECLRALVAESKKQTDEATKQNDMLKSIDIRTAKQNATLEEMSATSKTMCRAEQSGCRAGELGDRLEEVVAILKRLDAHDDRIAGLEERSGKA